MQESRILSPEVEELFLIQQQSKQQIESKSPMLKSLDSQSAPAPSSLLDEETEPSAFDFIAKEEGFASSPLMAPIEEGASHAKTQLTALDRLQQMCERVNVSQEDHDSGLNRLLSEFQTEIEEKQREKKALVQRRKDLAKQETIVGMRLREAQESLLKEAKAERYDVAQQMEDEVKELQAELMRIAGECKKLIESYESLDSEQEEYHRKAILARREACKFLSSVQQDASAKAQQDVRDAHTRLEGMRVSIERDETALVTKQAKLQESHKEMETLIVASSDQQEREKRRRDVEEAEKR